MIQHTDSVWECWTEAGMLQCQNGATLWSDVCVCVGHNYVTSSLKPFPSSLPLTFPRGNYIYTSRWIINKMNHKEFQITSQRTLINTTVNSVNVRPHTEPHVQPKPRQSEHGDAWTNIDVFFFIFKTTIPLSTLCFWKTHAVEGEHSHVIPSECKTWGLFLTLFIFIFCSGFFCVLC